ncbi:hypothetical protein [Poinsettia branch-inducing phytoplasma]|uniref:hypothetical protein n=1 Tax=Poinsettia branch-inducing phytoplasma TaxID=138647 RepID=UPI000366E6B3|nr:hypothetical protein [Poinsettia branch-inducing phytoplasma]
MNTNNKNKNTLLTIIAAIIALFFVAASIYAIANYFFKQKKEQIKIATEIPLFDVVRTGGNNEDKAIIPLPLPNLNPTKYAHTVSFDHEAILNDNGMDIDTPLYLKLKITYDTHNTFNNPSNFFPHEVKVNNSTYDDTKRPQMILKDGKGALQVRINLEQKEIINTKNPQLTLICDYELVDKDGNSFGGGTQTVETKIAQHA